MDGIPYGAGYWRLNVSCIALDNSSTSDSSSSSEKFKDGTNWDARNWLQKLVVSSQQSDWIVFIQYDQMLLSHSNCAEG
jgi:hypothetical protein